MSAGVNYFTSALPFLSAAQGGFMGEGFQVPQLQLMACRHTSAVCDDDYTHDYYSQVQMQVPAGIEDFCTTHADCAARYPDPMSKWDAFFQVLKHTETNPPREQSFTKVSCTDVTLHH